MYQSSQSVTEDSQSRGRGRIIYTDYTALTISNRHEKKANLPSLQWWCSCVSCCCCAGGSSVRFSSNCACLLSQFALLCTRPPPRSVSAVLFRQRCRDCFWYVVTDPILNSVCVKKYIHYDCTPLLLLQAAASRSSQCDFYRQPGGQQLLQY